MKMFQPTLSDYIRLIDSFVHDKITGVEFERKYLRIFKDDQTIRPQPEYEILNRLFSDVDAFCPDSRLRSANDLNEQQLRESARDALGRLQIFAAGNQS